MLQRIQSVYLFFAALVLFGLFLFPLAHTIYINGVASTIKVTGIFQDVNGQQHMVTPFTLLSIVTAIVGLIPLAIIFAYKNRKKQITFCYLTILVIIFYSFWLAQTVKDATGDGFEMKTGNMGIGIFLSSLSIVLILFAARAIKNDEKLIRSADRLR